MKARIKIAATQTSNGCEMALYQHDHDFSIMVNGQELMHSRQYQSEIELARLGCMHLVGCKAPSILIGGLGMGYTLRQALDMLGSHARVVVGELSDAVVDWNRNFLGALNGHPLGDPRVNVEVGDVVEIISRSRQQFDAILLDVDNGPWALTAPGNRRLYGYEGIQACRRALAQKGCLAVWSAQPSKPFEQVLMRCGFYVSRFRVPAGKGSKSLSRFVWVASENKAVIPAGGGEPRLKEKNTQDRRCSRRPRKR